MRYEWDSLLETGNTDIDTQHKELFGALNNLIEAYKHGKAPSEIQKTVEFLVNYVLKHFSDEEKLQERYEYPHMIEHKNIHGDLRRKVVNLIKKLAYEGYSNQFAEHTIRMLADWLTDHIKGEDFKIAAYIRKKTF
jgi:hemerythrin